MEKVDGGKSVGIRGSTDADKLYQFLNRLRNYKVNRLILDKYDKLTYYEATVKPKEGLLSV
jgi:hypothetical protein